jgi:CheY-like chemotaxis protein
LVVELNKALESAVVAYCMQPPHFFSYLVTIAALNRKMQRIWVYITFFGYRLLKGSAQDMMMDYAQNSMKSLKQKNTTYSYHLHIQTQCDIVIADDEQLIAQFIADVFEDEGYSVSVFHDGASALLAIMYGNPRLVVIDMMMPVMTGDEVVRIVRNRGITTMPIILMSAGANLDQYLSQGATAVLAKPFDIDRIISLAKQYLSE